ncbi:MAG TPA: DUF72 domain-containing protein, partial [Candidatus Binataceae bacterium]|nr:DUF72 domain-containing protein [Candidatus Binataceae bacterium]
YASRLRALEVDGTFYHMMRTPVFESWAKRTPDDFRFAIKGHRYITHIKRLEPPARSIRLQRENSSALGVKLAAVLWQLPPNMHKDIARLERFAAALDSWRETRHAIEFRHQSWFDDETAAVMTRERLANCQSDASKWPIWEAVTTDLVFVRLHGHTDTYASNYGDAELEQWARRARGWLREERDVHVYFDNDARGHAPWNAITLGSMLGVTPDNRSKPNESSASARRVRHRSV